MEWHILFSGRIGKDIAGWPLPKVLSMMLNATTRHIYKYRSLLSHCHSRDQGPMFYSFFHAPLSLA